MSSHAIDDPLALLADHQRRLVIDALRRNPRETTSVERLAERLEGEAHVRGNGRQADAREIAVDLHHFHLPKLADSGILSYDHRNGTVRYHGDGHVEALLDSLSEEPADPNF